MSKNNQLPKSLHTVTVLVRMARLYMGCERYPADAAVERSLRDLGYSDATDDPHGLRAAAVKQLLA